MHTERGQACSDHSSMMSCVWTVLQTRSVWRISHIKGRGKVYISCCLSLIEYCSCDCVRVTETCFNCQTPVLLLLQKLCVFTLVSVWQSHLEELVKQEGEPVGEHLFSNRLCPVKEAKATTKQMIRTKKLSERQYINFCTRHILLITKQHFDPGDKSRSTHAHTSEISQDIISHKVHLQTLLTSSSKQASAYFHLLPNFL